MCLLILLQPEPFVPQVHCRDKMIRTHGNTNSNIVDLQQTIENNIKKL